MQLAAFSHQSCIATGHPEVCNWPFAKLLGHHTITTGSVRPAKAAAHIGRLLQRQPGTAHPARSRAAEAQGQPQPWAASWGWAQAEARPGCQLTSGHTAGGGRSWSSDGPSQEPQLEEFPLGQGLALPMAATQHLEPLPPPPTVLTWPWRPNHRDKGALRPLNTCYWVKFPALKGAKNTSLKSIYISICFVFFMFFSPAK